MNIGIVFATKSIVSKWVKNSDHSFSCTAGETIRRTAGRFFSTCL